MKVYKVGKAELVTGRFLFDDLEDLVVAKAIFDEYERHLDYTVDIYPGVSEKSDAYRYVVAVVMSRYDSGFKKVIWDIDRMLTEAKLNWWTTLSPEIVAEL